MAISKDFQQRLHELADELVGKNKTEKANNINIDPTSFSRAYNYGIVPKTPTLIKIADYFNISIEYLMGITDVEHFVKSQLPKTFIERLNELRAEKGIKANYALSQQVHIHRNNIRQWYIINCLPLIDDLFILADYFEVSIDYLLGRTDDRTLYK
jgi:hypothetical protein